MNFPSKVRVGFFTYEIVADDQTLIDKIEEEDKDAGLELLGMCGSRELKICIAENLPLQRQQEVVWHELMHAIQDVSGIQACYEMTAEAAIGTLATMQLQVLHDNPELTEYLLAKD